MADLLDGVERHKRSHEQGLRFEDTYIPRGQNGTADHLDRTSRSFHGNICFVGCCIPV